MVGGGNTMSFEDRHPGLKGKAVWSPYEGFVHLPETPANEYSAFTVHDVASTQLDKIKVKEALLKFNETVLRFESEDACNEFISAWKAMVKELGLDE